MRGPIPLTDPEEHVEPKRWPVSQNSRSGHPDSAGTSHWHRQSTTQYNTNLQGLQAPPHRRPDDVAASSMATGTFTDDHLLRRHCSQGHHRTRRGHEAQQTHIDIRYHYEHELVQIGEIAVEWVATSLMVADILTKSLDRYTTDMEAGRMRMKQLNTCHGVDQSPNCSL